MVIGTGTLVAFDGAPLLNIRTIHEKAQGVLLAGLLTELKGLTSPIESKR